MKTITLFLPIPYRGGTLNGAKNIAKMLLLGSQATKQSLRINFSCCANTYNLQEDFSDLKKLGIDVYETDWKTTSAEEIKALMQDGETKDLKQAEYLLPQSLEYNFCRSDFWLIISDRLEKTLAPLKPFGLVVYDYIQRYVPEIFSFYFSDLAYLQNARAAKFVLVTTPGTREDAIQYAGIAADKVHLVPMEFNPFDIEPVSAVVQDDYFIWTSNSTLHKNHLRAFDALEIYYTRLAGKLRVIMTGAETHLFSEKTKSFKKASPYVLSVRNTLTQKASLKNKLQIVGDVNTGQYLALLKSAKFLWHPTLIDNGTYTVIEAAYYGVPALSSDYPQMLYLNERFKLNLNFFDASDPENMATGLKMMEENCVMLRQQLPTKEFLQGFSYQNIATEFYSLIGSLL